MHGHGWNLIDFLLALNFLTKNLEIFAIAANVIRINKAMQCQCAEQMDLTWADDAL